VSGPRSRVEAGFRQRFGDGASLLVRAPGRVNLIGEHTDYNDGFVLPMAIDRSAWIALRPRSDREVRVVALDLELEDAFDLDTLGRRKGWIAYLEGVAWALQGAGHPLRGWEGVLASDVPRGSGLSSSAALELATMRAFEAVSDFAWDPAAMATLGQRVENGWMGVNSGIMDQLISATGRRDHALLIDCRSLATEPHPLPEGTLVVVLDTGTRRGLVDSAYNERRTQCEAAAAAFGVPALRDVGLERFERESGDLDPLVRRRARHVIAENARTLAAASALRANDATALGELMNASHISLRDDFEVSSPALDAMVACAQAQPGCLGARMTGAGFGGAAVALIEAGAVAAFVPAVERCYRDASSNAPELYVCTASEGASRER
jgi:galactokinase